MSCFVAQLMLYNSWFSLVNSHLRPIFAHFPDETPDFDSFEGSNFLTVAGSRRWRRCWSAVRRRAATVQWLKRRWNSRALAWVLWRTYSLLLNMTHFVRWFTVPIENGDLPSENGDLPWFTHWKWWFTLWQYVNMVIFHSYVCLPEGSLQQIHMTTLVSG